jgi:acid phosphatase type 7
VPRVRPFSTFLAYLVVVTVIGLAFALALRNFGSGITPGGSALPPSPSSPPAGATNSASATSASGSASPATAAPSSGNPAAVLVGAGDIADCASNGDEATADLLDSIEGTVFTLGDNVYEAGTPSEFRRCYAPTWGRQLARTMPVPGNHDYETAGAAGYFGYFGAAAGDPGEGYYAYDRGSWRIYVLNSNCAAIGGCDAGSRQERWLHDDLAANPRSCVLAMWHHPRFSSGAHGNDPATQALWETLYDAGADLVLNGHDHTYERFAPQSPSGQADARRGIVEMVVGTGGRSHYDFPTVRANSVVRDETSYGVLRLELGDGGWSFEFVPVAGASFTDSGSGTCH